LSFAHAQNLAFLNNFLLGAPMFHLITHASLADATSIKVPA
jgi:hypothetical protein